MLNLVVNNNFKINRKVIDKEFVKIQIARKTAEKTYIHNFLLLAFFTQSHYKSPPFSVCVSFSPQGEKNSS